MDQTVKIENTECTLYPIYQCMYFEGKMSLFWLSVHASHSHHLCIERNDL